MEKKNALNRVLLVLAAVVMVVSLYSMSTILGLGVSSVETTYGEDAVGVLQPILNITRGGPRADEGWGVAVDIDGNVYFAGFDRISRATANIFLRKFASDGVEVWNASWGGQFDDEAFIVVTQNEYVYVGGRTFTSFSLASANMFVLKFHASNGSLVWSQTWDGGNGYDEVDGLVADGNSLYVAGWTTGASSQLDIAVLKYDVNGTLIWSRSWGTRGVDEANGQIAVDENYIYVVGHYNALPLGLGGEALLVAFSKTDGSYVWNTTWGGAGLDDAFGMTMDSAYIYSVGITNSFGGDLIFLLKYDKKGSLIWNVTWGGSGSESARAIGINTNSIYVAGNTMSFGKGSFDVVLLKYDQNGNLKLSKTWGGALLDQAHGMAVYDSVIYIAGETSSYGAGAEDAFLLKVDGEDGKTDSVPPAANAGLDQTIEAGEKVNFDASQSSDNIGIMSYYWDFGDGTAGTGETTTHTYVNPGIYTVKLTVSDAAGNSAADTITVTVKGVLIWWFLAAVIVIGIITMATIYLRKKRKTSLKASIVRRGNALLDFGYE